MPATYDEAETLVQSRKLADKIVRELEETMSRPVPYVPPPPALEPEELLPPPPSIPSGVIPASWSTTLPIAGAPALLKKPAITTVRKRQRKRKARSHLHWAVLAMCLAIGLGLWRDPSARANAKKGFFAETHRVVKVVGTHARTVSSRVSARVI
jgi:hypothetical protein